METIYKQDLNDEYLILKDVGEVQEDYRFHMILSNHIKGVLPCSMRSLNQNLHFYYIITGMVSLEDYLAEKKAGNVLVRNFLSSILELENRCTDYLLDIRNVILDARYIYIQDEKFSYCYLPIHQGNPAKDIHTLIGIMLEHGDYEDEEGIELLYKLHSKTRDKYNLRSVIQKIFMEEGDPVSPGAISGSREPEHGRREKTLSDHLRKSEQEEETSLNLEILYGDYPGEGDRESIFARILKLLNRRKKKTNEDIDENKTNEKHPNRKAKDFWEEEPYSYDFSDSKEWEYMEEDPPTTFLYVGEFATKEGLRLTSVEGNERLLIDHTPFIIGSGSSGIDGFVGNPTVSRKHCKITEEYGDYYIQDLSSMNGTFLNGRRLKGAAKQQIFQGDLIRIAGKEYVVQQLSGGIKNKIP